jgi:hypothetical protein
MKITLDLQDDALKEIRSYAKRRGLSLGMAASELVRRGARYKVGTRKVNGLAVFDVPDDFPVITIRRVQELANEE